MPSTSHKRPRLPRMHQCCMAGRCAERQCSIARWLSGFTAASLSTSTTSCSGFAARTAVAAASCARSGGKSSVSCTDGTASEAAALAMPWWRRTAVASYATAIARRRLLSSTPYHAHSNAVGPSQTALHRLSDCLHIACARAYTVRLQRGRDAQLQGHSRLRGAPSQLCAAHDRKY